MSDESVSPARMVARLASAADDLAGMDLAEISDGALADVLVDLRRQMDRLDGAFARLVRVGHVREVGSVDGAASTTAWLRWRAGMREGDARAALEAGAACEVLPAMGEAWRAGEISTSAARTIVGTRVDGHDDELAECETVLLELARSGDPRGLRRACAHFRNLARSEGTEPVVPDGLSVSRTFQNRWVLSGELGDVAAETVLTALRTFADVPSSEDRRSTSQRLADSLVRVREVAIAHADDPDRPMAAVTVVVDWPTLTRGRLGRCDGEFTGPIRPDDVQRLLCDCSVSRVVTGPRGMPVDVGRSRRTVPPPMRRALVVRDDGCRFPGCDRLAGWADAHHVVHWVNGGATSLENLVLLCRHHHQTVHRPGWSATFDGAELGVTRPDGVAVFGDVGPPGSTSEIPSMARSRTRQLPEAAR